MAVEKANNLHGSACYQTNGSLLHCLSTLTDAPCQMAWCVKESVAGFFPGKSTCSSPGRFISVALALESPPPDVIRHPALRSPDFPHPHLAMRPRSFILLSTCCFLSRLKIFIFKLLYIETASSYKLSANGIFRKVVAADADKIFQKL